MRSPFSAMTLLDNFRGGYGNGGIMRSPLSAIALLDYAEPSPLRNHYSGLSGSLDCRSSRLFSTTDMQSATHSLQMKTVPE